MEYERAGKERVTCIDEMRNRGEEKGSCIDEIKYRGERRGTWIHRIRKREGIEGGNSDRPTTD